MLRIQQAVCKIFLTGLVIALVDAKLGEVKGEKAACEDARRNEECLSGTVSLDATYANKPTDVLTLPDPPNLAEGGAIPEPMI